MMSISPFFFSLKSQTYFEEKNYIRIKNKYSVKHVDI